MSDNEEKIKSRELLKPKFRTKHQTTEFIYKALYVAEQQIEEQLLVIDALTREISELKNK
jgi:hypothetical protein